MCLANLFDLTIAKNRSVVCHLAHNGKVMADKKDGQAKLGL